MRQATPEQRNVARADSELAPAHLAASRTGLHILPQDIRIRDNGSRRYLFNYSRETQDLNELFPGAQVEMGSLQPESCGVACIRLPDQAAAQRREHLANEVTT